eukprot:3669299-Pleurochrysis_carterae.AAC.1
MLRVGHPAIAETAIREYVCKLLVGCSTPQLLDDLVRKCKQKLGDFDLTELKSRAIDMVPRSEAKDIVWWLSSNAYTLLGAPDVPAICNGASSRKNKRLEDELSLFRVLNLIDAESTRDFFEDFIADC